MLNKYLLTVKRVGPLSPQIIQHWGIKFRGNSRGTITGNKDSVELDKVEIGALKVALLGRIVLSPAPVEIGLVETVASSVGKGGADGITVKATQEVSLNGVAP